MNRAFAREPADWPGLAAAPTFAAMALATAASDSARIEGLCRAGGGWAPDGMVVMYLLMSAFHVSPWLKRRGRGRPIEETD